MTNRGTGSEVVEREEELLEALRRQDISAAEHLVSTYGHRVYRLAVGITGNREDAEEAVQDAFWTVIRKIGTFRRRAALGSWIYRIAANAAYHTRRSSVRRRPEIRLDEILPRFHEDGSYAEPIVDWSAELDDPAVQGELRHVLTSALQELPDHYRAVIILNDVEVMPMAEVAECLGITVPTARGRVHRARLFLRHRLGASCPAHHLASRWSLKADENASLGKEIAMRFSRLQLTVSSAAAVTFALVLLAALFPSAGSTQGSPPSETVTVAADKPIPNLLGKRLVTHIVDYPPGARSAAHRHAGSAFIFAYVVSGEIRSQVDDEPVRVYRAGETWFKNPGAHHRVSENASDTKPAQLLAVLIVDTADKELVIPTSK